MSSSSADQVLTLAEAARLLMPLRGGRMPHRDTVRYWARHGFRGVVLESYCVGGRRYTTRAALERFLAQVDPLAPMPDGGASDWQHSE